MATDISIKQFGVTLEFQIDDHRLYINPLAEKDDRRPENGELILSFIRASISELHLKSALAAHYTGLVRYGFEKTTFLVCPQVQTYVRAVGDGEVAEEPFPHRPSLRSLDGYVHEFGSILIGTDVLQLDGQLYGAGLSIDDNDFHYFYVDEKYVEDFTSRRSTCALLVSENWARQKDSIRQIILADQSEVYYLVCPDLRKNDLKELQTILPQSSVDKIVCKKGKWKFATS